MAAKNLQPTVWFDGFPFSPAEEERIEEEKAAKDDADFERWDDWERRTI